MNISRVHSQELLAAHDRLMRSGPLRFGIHRLEPGTFEEGVVLRLPIIRGTIDRRILANYRIDPSVLGRLLPAPFRPQLVGGFGIAGICMIRLTRIRPRLLPAFAGLSSENAAHRIAVEWEENGDLRTGVYIPRRDTSSWLNAAVGGRVFPGEHHRARFDVEETADLFKVAMTSVDQTVRLRIEAKPADALPAGSVFDSLEHVSRFFEEGSLGYSPTSAAGRLDGLELRTPEWRVRPMNVASVESSWFDDTDLFPAGSVEFDNALLMQGIEHEWHGRGSMCCGDAG